jgi:hypothetical protein
MSAIPIVMNDYDLIVYWINHAAGSVKCCTMELRHGAKRDGLRSNPGRQSRRLFETSERLVA